MSYSNQLIHSLDAALSADLSKSQWRIFAALLRQTLGYGKTVDDLSMRRLTQLTGLRQDHAKSAIKSLVSDQLISSEPGHYGQCYSINGVAEVSKFWLEAPKNRGKSNRELGIDNSRPLQSQTTTHGTDLHSASDITVADTQPEAGMSQPTPCCSDPDIDWPTSISIELRDTVLMVTRSLSHPQQQSVISVLGEMIRQRKVKSSPIQLLYALVKAAKNQALDTSILKTSLSTQSNIPASPCPTPQSLAIEAHSKRMGLSQHAELLGVTPEALAQQWGMM